MSFLRSKSKYRSLLYIRLGIVFCVVVSIMLCFSVYERYKVKSEMTERREETEKDLTALKERKYIIEKKVDYLSREEGVEAEIRRHFDVAREGEQVVVLVGADEEKEIIPIPKDEEVKKSFWLSWLPW